ncbi:hypothetical protein CTAYLR_001958 [Chrysophaeum taylorii]|uniref:Lipase maturation factor n=1 Tax=Chrysophaeum taylorii TaxID=2483200 RepID=A0AAD7U8Y1_9STRA|nr:hypothetical protein CTAYLR_001958 [Chrysophaeum taylorii]
MGLRHRGPPAAAAPSEQPPPPRTNTGASKATAGKQWAGAAREAACDALDTVRECVAYARQSASTSEECARAWRFAWLAQACVCAVGFGLSQHPPARESYRVAEALMRRGLGAIYCVAFAIALRTNRPLIGSRGLSPAARVVRRCELALSQRPGATTALDRVLVLPTACWIAARDGIVDDSRIDSCLDMLAGSGLACGALALASGPVLGKLSLAACYVGYLSIASVGQPFYSYGWESQLLETTFLAVASFLFPPVVAMRWLCFKIMLGAGLIKERAKHRASDCWRDLTAMTTFFETQPAPGPLSRRLHFLPRPALLFATASNHVIELFAPWFLLASFLPFRLARRALVASYGLTHVAFQLTLICSGNLSFLNYVTIVPALACFDDAFFGYTAAPPPRGASTLLHALGVAVLAWLNVPAYENLFAPSSTSKSPAPRQAMNAQFDRLLPLPNRTVNLRVFRLGNAYGAFGSVSPARDEIVVFGSRGALDGWQWHEYELHASPGQADTSCPQIAPWHLRLDWQKWISACRGRDATTERWFIVFLLGLLDNDPDLARLLRTNPFRNTTSPTHLRVQIFRYQFAPLDQPVVWTRQLRSTLVRPVSRPELQAALSRFDTTY